MSSSTRETRAQRPALSEITNNNSTVQSADLNDDERKRLERNTQQRKRRADMTDEQREKINRKQREYRARKKAQSMITTSAIDVSQSVTTSTPTVPVFSPWEQPQDKENIDPDDPMDWLHKDDNYVRRRFHAYPTDQSLQSICTNEPPIIRNEVGSSSRDKVRIYDRVWYNNMNEQKKEDLLQRKREYYQRAKLSFTESPKTPLPNAIPDGQVCSAEPDIEFDRELFEPAHAIEQDEESDMNPIHELHTDDLYDDQGIRQLLTEGHAYESFRVHVDGASGNHITDDPYELIYQNLPPTHKLRNVPDCQYCGAIRFQYEPPGFCCRKGKISVHILEIPDELKRLFTSQVHDDAKYFRNHIRYFNSHFSFTSLGVTLDRRVSTAAGTGIYTFRVQGG